jgi:hypothetical protein
VTTASFWYARKEVIALFADNTAGRLGKFRSLIFGK